MAFSFLVLFVYSAKERSSLEGLALAEGAIGAFFFIIAHFFEKCKLLFCLFSAFFIFFQKHLFSTEEYPSFFRHMYGKKKIFACGQKGKDEGWSNEGRGHCPRRKARRRTLCFAGAAIGGRGSFAIEWEAEGRAFFFWVIFWGETVARGY